VELIDPEHRPHSHKEHNGDKCEKNSLLAHIRELNRSFTTIKELSDEEEGEVEQNESTSLPGEMVLLLVLDVSELRGHTLDESVIISSSFFNQVGLLIDGVLVVLSILLLLNQLHGLLRGSLNGPGDGDTENADLCELSNGLSEHHSEERSHENTWHSQLHDLVVDAVSLGVIWVLLFEIQDESENGSHYRHEC
jgi:hypothetical protein